MRLFCLYQHLTTPDETIRPPSPQPQRHLTENHLGCKGSPAGQAVDNWQFINAFLGMLRTSAPGGTNRQITVFGATKASGRN